MNGRRPGSSPASPAPQQAAALDAVPDLEVKTWGGYLLEKAEADGGDRGRVKSLVAVTGNFDDGGDRIIPGGVEFPRRPVIVWHHDLKILVGKVLAFEEWLPGDKRLPDDLLKAGFGGVYFDSLFDLEDPDGFKAWRKVDFHDEIGWSIGYRAIGPVRRKASPGIPPGRDLVRTQIFEGSPLPFGMNVEARTLDVKTLQSALDYAGVGPDAVEKIVVALKEAVPVTGTTEVPETPEKKFSPPLEGSMEALRQAVSEAVQVWAADAFGERSDENPWWVWVEATFDDRVIVQAEVQGETSYFEVPFVASEEGIELGEASPVDVETTVVVSPAGDPEAGADESGTSGADDPPEVADAMKAVEEDLAHLVASLDEKAGRVLSSANRAKVQAAVDALAALIAAAEKDDEKESASKALPLDEGDLFL